MENSKNYENLKHLKKPYLGFPKRRNTRTSLLLCKLRTETKSRFHYFFIGKPFYQNEDQPEESSGFLEGNNIQIGSPARSSPHSQGSDNGERFSRKVFVGGLPPDIDEGKYRKCQSLNQRLLATRLYFDLLIPRLSYCKIHTSLPKISC